MGSESLSHDYEELSLLFEEAGVDTTAAEAHGIITGVLGVPTQSQLDWLPLILGTQPLIANAAADELPERLQTLWREVAGMLRQGEFEFALLLPDQQQRLEERAEALANWCRGYLLGLAQAGARGAQDLSADATEIVGDMMHIAEVELENEADPEAQEKALVELEEYLRMGVQLIFDEMHMAQTNPTAND